MTPDETLLSRWQAGDRAAGMELVGRHYDSIVRFFQTKAAREADDLVQRTFLACSEAASRYSGEGSFRAFLFGIARNVLFEHIRRDVRLGRHTDFHALSVADMHPGVSTQAARRADSRVVLRALQLIPVESQILVELYYWEELPMADVAAALEIPVGTAKSRLHRARQQLKEALERVPDETDDPRSARLLLAEWIARLEAHGDPGGAAS